MRRTCSIIAVLALPVLAAMPALAQQPDGDALGRELVTALLGPGEVWVGRLPDGFPAGVLPPNARLLGGRTEPLHSGGVHVAAAVPEERDTAMAAAQRSLLQAGWENTERIESPGGFRDEPSPRMFALRSVPRLFYSVFCRGGERMTLTVQGRSEGGSNLLLQYENNRNPTLCAQSHEWMRMTSTQHSPIPVLYAPRAVRSSWNHLNIAEGSYETTAELRTPMPAAALAAHYAAQLRRAGWTRAARPAISRGGAVHTFHYRDSNGAAWSAVLIVAAVPDSEMRKAAFRATPRPAPTRD
ncbi:MAG TPA: hypothetical protein VGC13_00195 [Longimicrobium sp.]|jgi:hypothetical protein|uniref:hypothetical protein n=1 Tax=Longimicrobium sp. TaxID=2029185 RepID=UPI002EDA855C